MTFTQPLCDDCWDARNPDSPSPRIGKGPDEKCCDCGNETRSGIYFRADPASVAYPASEGSE